MPVNVYRSGDPGAPALNGTAGSLIAVLKACLVDGYGSKLPAGWSMPFSSGSPITKAVFKQGPKTGLPQYHLRVVDDGTLTAGGREAALRAYETMTGIDTGTNEFPTSSQLAAGAICRKSHTADATARPWMLLADDRTFILLIYHASGFNTSYGSAGYGYGGMYFGDYVPVSASYAYRCVLIAKSAQNVTTDEGIGGFIGPSIGGLTWGCRVLARDYAGAASSRPCGMLGSQFSSVPTVEGGGEGAIAIGSPAASGQARAPLMAGANPADGKLWVGPIWLYQTSPSAVVGYLRGVWAPAYTGDSVTDGAQYTGAGPLSGRTLEHRYPVRFRDGSGTSYSPHFHGALVLEVSNTWDA